MEIKVDLEKLTKELTVKEVSFMPKGTYLVKGDEDQAFCQLIPYKNARVDMDILDDACGIYWQTEFKRDSNGVLQCGIGIYFHDIGEWIWRWYNGTPSQYEKEKGEYSDAFKRAGTMWGIGRELYSYPPIKVTLNKDEYSIIEDSGKPVVKLANRFKPNFWQWEIKKSEGGAIWVIGKYKNKVRCDTNPYESKNPRS